MLSAYTVSYWIYFLLFSIRTCFFKGKNLIFSMTVSLGMMIEGYSNLSNGGTFNVGSVGSYFLFSVMFQGESFNEPSGN